MKKPKNLSSWAAIILFAIISLLIVSSLTYGIYISPPPEEVGYYFTKSSDFDPDSLPVSTRRKLQEQETYQGFACILFFLVFCGITLWAVLFDKDED